LFNDFSRAQRRRCTCAVTQTRRATRAALLTTATHSSWLVVDRIATVEVKFSQLGPSLVRFESMNDNVIATVAPRDGSVVVWWVVKTKPIANAQNVCSLAEPLVRHGILKTDSCVSRPCVRYNELDQISAQGVPHTNHHGTARCQWYVVVNPRKAVI
jgi:hypothetical protein